MKNSFKLYIFFFMFAVLPFFPPAARSDDWFLVTKSESGTKYFVDRDSIKKSGQSYTAKIFVVYGTATESGTIGYTSLREFSCKDKKSRDQRTNYFNEDGSTKRVGQDTEWRFVTPNSVLGEIVESVCSF